MEEKYKTKFRKLKREDWLKLGSIYFFSIAIFTTILLIYGYAINTNNIITKYYIYSLIVISIVFFVFRHDILNIKPYKLKQKQKQTSQV